MIISDTLNSYLEASYEASHRPRKIAFFLIIASILSFAAFWNSRKGSWTNHALKLTRVAVASFPAKTIGIRSGSTDSGSLRHF